jgi:hypothetical protein
MPATSAATASAAPPKMRAPRLLGGMRARAGRLGRAWARPRWRGRSRRAGDAGVGGRGGKRRDLGGGRVTVENSVCDGHCRVRGPGGSRMQRQRRGGGAAGAAAVSLRPAACARALGAACRSTGPPHQCSAPAPQWAAGAPPARGASCRAARAARAGAARRGGVTDAPRQLASLRGGRWASGAVRTLDTHISLPQTPHTALAGRRFKKRSTPRGPRLPPAAQCALPAQLKTKRQPSRAPPRPHRLAAPDRAAREAGCRHPSPPQRRQDSASGVPSRPWRSRRRRGA